MNGCSGVFCTYYRPSSLLTTVRLSTHGTELFLRCHTYVIYSV